MQYTLANVKMYIQCVCLCVVYSVYIVGDGLQLWYHEVLKMFTKGLFPSV